MIFCHKTWRTQEPLGAPCPPPTHKLKKINKRHKLPRLSPIKHRSKFIERGHKHFHQAIPKNWWPYDNTKLIAEEMYSGTASKKQERHPYVNIYILVMGMCLTLRMKPHSCLSDAHMNGYIVICRYNNSKIKNAIL